MAPRFCVPVVGLVVLFVAAGPVWGDVTNLVYTYGGSFDLRIPADSGETRGWMQNAVVYVPDHILICDLDVRVDIQHTAAFDLQLSLKSPSGQRATLNVSDAYEGYYEGQDYDSTTFDDEATIQIQDALPPFSGSFQPVDALAVYDAQDAYGLWQLRVYDMYYGDTGYLNSFVLIITGSLEKQAVAVPLPVAGGLSFLGMVLIASVRRLTGSFGAERRLSRGLSVPGLS